MRKNAFCKHSRWKGNAVQTEKESAIANIYIQILITSTNKETSEHSKEMEPLRGYNIQKIKAQFSHATKTCWKNKIVTALVEVRWES